MGKYIQLHDAYLSVVEALKHGGIAGRVNIHIRWVDSEEIERQGCEALLQGVDGILIPGGFGLRGTEGKIQAAGYAREKKIPFLGDLSGHADGHRGICKKCGGASGRRQHGAESGHPAPGDRSYAGAERSGKYRRGRCGLAPIPAF